MRNFVMYCKTYSGDLSAFSNLVDSFSRHNADQIVLYASVPESELDLFGGFECEYVKILADESFARDYFAEMGHWGMSIGYANQEICKLTFYKTNLAQNYLCLDADSYFIRDFFISDFMFDEVTPYTVLVMDKDLSVERHYWGRHWQGRQKAVRRIYEYMGLDDPRLRTCHGFQVLNAKVLESLESDFMRPRGLKHNDLLEIAPYEYTWYNVWFQKACLVKEVAVEPFFKTMHMRPEYIFSRLRLLREADFAKAYVGLVLNSKWRPRRAPLKYKDPKGLFSKIFYYFAIYVL